MYSRTVSSVFLSIHLSVCLPSPTSCHLSIRAASSPNRVASRSQMPPQYLTVRYVPAILKGWVSHFNQAPSLPAALLCCHQFWSFPFQIYLSVLLSLSGMNGSQCFLKCAFILMGATVATTYYSASTRDSWTISEIGFAWAKVRY